MSKHRDNILFKHYTYRGGSEYVDIIMAMDEWALRVAKAVRMEAILLIKNGNQEEVENIDIEKFMK